MRGSPAWCRRAGFVEHERYYDSLGDVSTTSSYLDAKTNVAQV